MDTVLIRPLRYSLFLLVAGATLLSTPCPAQRADDTAPPDHPWSSLLGDDVFTSWNGGPSATALQPGPKVLFFGRGIGCAGSTTGGPVSVTTLAKQADKDRVRKLTGLAPGERNRLWMPSGDAPGCDGSARGRTGDSLAFVNAEKGCALYTASEPGGRAFWRPFDASGQNGSGANAHIEGTFVNFRQAWWRPDAQRPWRDTDAELQMVSTQTVATVSTGSDIDGGEPRQVKQQMIASFVNPVCRKETGKTPNLCQIQYLFNTGIYRSGVKDWSTVSWFQQAGLFGDPGQGGMPVIHGPIDPAGQVTRESTTGLALYRSEGSPTRHDTFEDVRFDVRISFTQLLNALHVIVGRKIGKPADGVSDEQMRAEFGSAWNVPSAWVLVSTDIGQEVYNSSPDATPARIGGSVRSLVVQAASPPSKSTR